MIKECDMEGIDPQLARKQHTIFTRDGWQCQGCGKSENTLFIHQRYKIDGRSIWQYPDWALVTMCESCNKLTHVLNAAAETDWERVLKIMMGADQNQWKSLAAVLNELVSKPETPDITAVVFAYNRPDKSKAIEQETKGGAAQ